MFTIPAAKGLNDSILEMLVPGGLTSSSIFKDLRLQTFVSVRFDAKDIFGALTNFERAEGRAGNWNARKEARDFQTHATPGLSMGFLQTKSSVRHQRSMTYSAVANQERRSKQLRRMKKHNVLC